MLSPEISSVPAPPTSAVRSMWKASMPVCVTVQAMWAPLLPSSVVMGMPPVGAPVLSHGVELWTAHTLSGRPMPIGDARLAATYAVATGGGLLLQPAVARAIAGAAKKASVERRLLKFMRSSPVED